MIKWNPSKFVENRTFDHRLVKENLMDSRGLEPPNYKDRTDFRAFRETYVILFVFLFVCVYVYVCFYSFILFKVRKINKII